MKNNLNRTILLAAVIIVCVWMVMKFMEGRKLREDYEMSKTDLLAYVKNEKLNHIEVMNRIGHLTKDEDLPRDAYYLAKNDDRDSLVKLVEGL